MRNVRAAWLDALLSRPEDERIEFKQAQKHFDQEKLEQYCCALANEGGGALVLGVTEKPTPHVTGTQAFRPPTRIIHHLIHILRLKVVAEEISHPQGRVLVFHVPSRPIGLPIQHQGRYLMRGGESLLPMTPDQLQRIFAECGPDFSAQPVTDASMADLLADTIEDFRRRWIRKSGNQHLATLSPMQLLNDAELLVDGVPTIAALVLFGAHAALGRHLGQAEVMYEYRSTEASGAANQRVDFRVGFFAFYEQLWDRINARNDIQHFQDGLFILDIPTFNEKIIREAILNAIAHRDYRLSGSITVRQYPHRLEITSPGGFPEGITLENLLWRQQPRNRRLAEAFGKCGLVERSGQGFNIMFEESIKESRSKPDFSGTDAHQVALTLSGEIRDPRFLQFLEKIGQETLRTFHTEDFLVIDLAYHGEPIPRSLTRRAGELRESGILERAENRKGEFILSRKFHAFLGSKGTYTRRKGLDRETNKALLLQHIVSNRDAGCRFREFTQVLPHLSRSQIQRLLQELQVENKIEVRGKTNASLWHPVDGA